MFRKIIPLLILAIITGTYSLADQNEEEDMSTIPTEVFSIGDKTYDVYHVSIIYKTPKKDGYIQLEDNSKWRDAEGMIEKSTFPNWYKGDRIIILNAVERPRGPIAKVFYNLENEESCLVYRTF